MNPASTIASSSDTTSIGLSTSVSEASPKIWETSTSTGARTSAIWIGLLSTIEKAYSDLPATASWTPTTFSTALPAMATITRPANASEIPSESIEGSSATTNQSETNAASTPETANIPTASQRGQRGASWPRPSSSSSSVSDSSALRRSENGSDSANSPSSTTDTIIEKVTSCSDAGACTKCARDGITHAVT